MNWFWYQVHNGTRT